MGMITRVRKRLQTLHLLAKMDSRLQEEKTAQSVWLLSAVLLLPYLARASHASLLFGGVGLAYSCLVLPMVISASYKYPVRPLFSALYALSGLAGWWAVAVEPVTNFLWKVYAPLERVERCIMKMANILSMINQLTFFTLCDRLLMPGQRLTCLYSLMFYNVVAYCASYIKELIEKEDWSPYVTMAEHSNIKHLAMSATKIVLEWTKAVTFVITVVFMLLVFGLEQGLQHYQPTVLYTVVTWIYYMATEKVFVDMFPTLLSFLRLDVLESLEALWAPVLLRAGTAGISLLAALAVAMLQYARNGSHGWVRLVVFALYFNVHLRLRELWLGPLRQLRAEQAVLMRFRPALPEELAAHDDVCAVCLSPMPRRARVTPCQHMFHAECLRLCLKTSDNCPICKREYTFC
ncbi:uncharacterized protein LOC126267351 isoform X1 [Schistocerca gregaria]|uniref:uncharacterized protein LOC126267351 isoform X1 n=1 Tax=Schistocerca gregaria TaxID=7010 RepID=UPI00211F1AD0|nr:uncharacterized protein LOC126267351 isoform X1 [Schistocerca gregaria]